MSHFAYLQSEFQNVHEAAAKAEKMATSDPRVAAFYARRAVELAVNWAFKHDENLRLPYQDNISALIHESSFIALAGQSILVLSRLRSGLPTHLCSLSFKGQGAFAPQR